MKVVLTTDGSSSAEKSLQWFTSLSICKACDLHVVTVMSSPPSAIDVVYVDDDYDEQERIWAHEAYSRASAILAKAGVAGQHVLRSGHAANEILAYAEAIDAQLIVIGARGSSAVQRIMLGSTSESVATHAHCPVLVVRHPDDPVTSLPPFKVVCAFDGSPAAQAAVSQVASQAWSLDAVLHLVYVVQYPAITIQEGTQAKYLTEGIKASLDDAVKLTSSRFAEVTTHVTNDVHIGDGILTYASKVNADLIVMGDTGQSAISRFFVGSNSRFVLRHADRSVWLAR